jgi:hypothetical protein
MFSIEGLSTDYFVFKAHHSDTDGRSPPFQIPNLQKAERAVAEQVCILGRQSDRLGVAFNGCSVLAPTEEVVALHTV